jgi:hypothetical protein
MANKNEPKPSFWPAKRSDSEALFDHATGCDILSQDENVRDGGVGRTKRTDTWQEKDKSDADGN